MRYGINVAFAIEKIEKTLAIAYGLDTGRNYDWEASFPAGSIQRGDVVRARVMAGLEDPKEK